MIDNHQFRSLFNLLRNTYGFRYWWPARDPLEVLEGAILAQNTNWNNVERALESIKGMEPRELLDSPDIPSKIRSAGFYRQKSYYLKTAIKYYVEKIDSCSLPSSTREELLRLKGIGRETADSIALYAFHERTIPIDSYTLRLFNRFFLEELTLKDYEFLRTQLSISFLTEELMEFHALVDEHSKQKCRRKPLCDSCPLREKCLFGVRKLSHSL
ncbi:MAG: hypothetical protein QW078_01740 [Thermoplasmatales archaeon]